MLPLCVQISVDSEVGEGGTCSDSEGELKAPNGVCTEPGQQDHPFHTPLTRMPMLSRHMASKEHMLFKLTVQHACLGVV